MKRKNPIAKYSLNSQSDEVIFKSTFFLNSLESENLIKSFVTSITEY